MNPTISPYLWFDHEAEEAANFYVSIFDDARITNISHYGEGAPMPAGTVLVVSFVLGGVTFNALNGGPGHPFTDAISFAVDAPTQDRVDYLWDSLIADGGQPGPCGWLTDKYGLSWQIVPSVLMELLDSDDAAASARMMAAMMQMGKLDIAALRAAYDG